MKNLSKNFNDGLISRLILYSDSCRWICLGLHVCLCQPNYLRFYEQTVQNGVPSSFVPV